jgi:hypothetical protein
MTDNTNISTEASVPAVGSNAVSNNAEAENLTLFDIADSEDISDANAATADLGNKQEARAEQGNVEASDKSKSPQEPQDWYYTDKIKGEGMPPEWFNHKTFKSISEQARAYNEARRQITQYSEKLKAFTGSPEEYEEAEDAKDKNNVFAAGLKELGKKIGLNQSGFNNLVEMYSKAKEIEAEKTKNNLLQQQKEERKKIGGAIKLKEIEAKFVDAFGDSSIPWLRKTLKTHDDYVNLERLVSGISAKTRLPVNSIESSISTREQAEELVRDPRWGRDKEFTKKADKLLSYMLQGKN